MHAVSGHCMGLIALRVVRLETCDEASSDLGAGDFRRVFLFPPTPICMGTQAGV